MATNSRLFRQETVEAVAPYPRLFARRLGAATFHTHGNPVTAACENLHPSPRRMGQLAKICTGDIPGSGFIAKICASPKS